MQILHCHFLFIESCSLTQFSILFEATWLNVVVRFQQFKIVPNVNTTFAFAVCQVGFFFTVRSPPADVRFRCMALRCTYECSSSRQVGMVLHRWQMGRCEQRCSCKTRTKKKWFYRNYKFYIRHITGEPPIPEGNKLSASV